MSRKQEFQELDRQREQQRQQEQLRQSQLAAAKEWALHQATEEEILAGLNEVQEKGGTELGELINRLRQQSKEHASSGAVPS